MKKLAFILLFILISSLEQVAAQVDIGIRFSPTFSFNRLQTDSDTLRLRTDGLGVRFMLGPILDFNINRNYYFSTGLFYAPKRVAYKSSSQSGNFNAEESYNLQYLQIPLNLKLLTNEVSLDKRLYFQLGTLIDVKINEKANVQDPIITKYNLFDAGINLGFGLDYRIGLNTRLNIGFGYYRGLFNVANVKQVALDERIKIKNDLFSIDFALIL
jgi:hypothetical protein